LKLFSDGVCHFPLGGAEKVLGLPTATMFFVFVDVCEKEAFLFPFLEKI